MVRFQLVVRLSYLSILGHRWSDRLWDPDNATTTIRVGRNALVLASLAKTTIVRSVAFYFERLPPIPLLYC